MIDDIAEEILLRLPVKSLVRCKSLSKEWREFISCNPAFRKRFIDRNRGCSFMLGFYLTHHMELVEYHHGEQVHFLPTYNNPAISVLSKRKTGNNNGVLDQLLPKKRKRENDRALLLKKSPSFFSDPAVRVLGSSNGFLLCSLDAKCPLNYIIINPINKLCMSLPAASASSYFYTHGFICRSESPQLDTVDYYKVVRGISPEDWDTESFTMLEIISSDSSRWSQFYVKGQSPFYLDSLNPSKIIVSETGLVYVPGTLYKEQEATDDGYNDNGVLIFDQSKQNSVHVMELPPAENEVIHECFGQSDGLISYARNDELGQLKIWRYNEQQGAGWSLVHNVSLESWVDQLKHIRNASATKFCPEAFHPTDKNVIFLGADGKKMVYNLDKSKMDPYCDLKTQGWDGVYYFFPYTCGLIGPHLFLSQD